MLRILTCSVLLACSLVLQAQEEAPIILGVERESNFCDCCSYNSLQFKQNEYESVFPPEVIKKNGYKEVVVTVSGRERSDTAKTNQIKVRKVLIKEYREIKFIFNDQGYVMSSTWYNRMGKPHSIHQFERNSSGKVTKDAFSYLDSLGGVFKDFGTEISILSYDQNNNLLKSKKMNFRGVEQPDAKSEYVAKTYDAKGKVVKEVMHYYFEGLTGESINVTTTKYDETNLTSESISVYDGGYTSTSKKKYNKLWKPVEEKYYNDKTKKLEGTNTYKYDSSGNLISYFHNQVERSSSECPETKDFLDLYTINSFGVIETITHNFDNRTCEMSFAWKKK